MHHRFDDVERWTAVFDDPERDAWQHPTELVAALDLQPGDVVADIGAGTGYFNPHLADAVGEQGRVIPIEVETALVEHMTGRAIDEATPLRQAGATSALWTSCHTSMSRSSKSGPDRYP